VAAFLQGFNIRRKIHQILTILISNEKFELGLSNTPEVV